MPRLLDVLKKCGRTTKVTRGEVRAFGTFSGFHPAMRRVLPAGETGLISEAGDSSFTWYDATTSAAKGLHVAIDLGSDPPMAIATLLPEIARQMKLTWE